MRQARKRGKRCVAWRGFLLLSALMAFAPMGPEASFFEVLDRHRASLLAALSRGGQEPPGQGTPVASRYRSSRRAARRSGGRPGAALRRESAPLGGAAGTLGKAVPAGLLPAFHLSLSLNLNLNS